ncbi:hypothetical protein K439DRAFT_1642294 [Ramaria rubella]|nr:hypothetical protein K439DRAFT_1642294 [Ramaria rubella]
MRVNTTLILAFMRNPVHYIRTVIGGQNLTDALGYIRADIMKKNALHDSSDLCKFGIILSRL